MSARSELLPCVEIGPKGPAKSAVIFLHGLGADGHDFEPIVPQLGLDPRSSVRFVFPHAPSIPVSLNGGFVMPAWYDIRDADLRSRHDEAGIRDTAKKIEALIAREVERGIPSRRIVLAGFSQGGAMAVHVALRHPHPLAGIVALSTYLVGADTVAAELSSANRGIPVFQAHGTQDPMVRFERGVALREKLVELGCDVTWREYPMPHAVCMEEIVEVGAWLNARFAEKQASAG
jgi:phospholipase/carboxylesterase